MAKKFSRKSSFVNPQILLQSRIFQVVHKLERTTVMPTRSSKSKDHDFTTVALRVVEQAIGENWDRYGQKRRQEPGCGRVGVINVHTLASRFNK
jgi:hypothetical protein